jgi:hypothetical protein
MYSYIRITIPQTKEDIKKFGLPSFNMMMGGSAFVKSAARKRFEKWFRRRLVVLRPPVFEKAVISYTLYRNNFLDQDNCFSIAKVINDALVNISVFKTDRFPDLRTVINDQIKCKKPDQRIVITIRPQPTDGDFREFITAFTGLPVMWQSPAAKPIRGSVSSGNLRKRKRPKTLFCKRGKSAGKNR